MYANGIINSLAKLDGYLKYLFTTDRKTIFSPGTAVDLVYLLQRSACAAVIIAEMCPVTVFQSPPFNQVFSPTFLLSKDAQLD